MAGSNSDPNFGRAWDDPSEDEERTVQNLQRPKCPGPLESSVSPTHCGEMKTTMLRMAEHTVKTPHRMAIAREFLNASWDRSRSGRITRKQKDSPVR